MLPWLLKAFHLAVTSASGSTLCPMGIVQCPFKLGGHSFKLHCIVCQNKVHYIRFGFYVQNSHKINLVRHQKRTSYFGNQSVSRNCKHLWDGLQLMTYSSLTLPPRILAVVSVHVDLKENSTEHTYEVKPNSFLMHGNHTCHLHNANADRHHYPFHYN